MSGEAGSDRAAAGRSGMPRERRRVVFSGRVQGVGFRFTCQSLARGFDVAGYVRNLADGRVELVAEGEPSARLSEGCNSTILIMLGLSLLFVSVSVCPAGTRRSHPGLE